MVKKKKKKKSFLNEVAYYILYISILPGLYDKTAKTWLVNPHPYCTLLTVFFSVFFFLFSFLLPGSQHS